MSVGSALAARRRRRRFPKESCCDASAFDTEVDVVCCCIKGSVVRVIQQARACEAAWGEYRRSVAETLRPRAAI